MPRACNTGAQERSTIWLQYSVPYKKQRTKLAWQAKSVSLAALASHTHGHIDQLFRLYYVHSKLSMNLLAIEKITERVFLHPCAFLIEYCVSGDQIRWSCQLLWGWVYVARICAEIQICKRKEKQKSSPKTDANSRMFRHVWVLWKCRHNFKFIMISSSHSIMTEWEF